MKIKVLNEDEIVVNRKELETLLYSLRGTVQSTSHAFIWFETEIQRQQEIRDDFCAMLSRRADEISKYLTRLE